MDSSRTNGRPSRSIYSISHFVFLALRAATPSIDIWWKPTVFRSSYVASRIALRDGRRLILGQGEVRCIGRLGVEAARLQSLDLSLVGTGAVAEKPSLTR